ncbi:TetR/AcrR family transcriptional regulator [Amycolatopsis sp. NPDC003731]
MGTRADLAARTRTDLLAAAKRLFTERGYLDTRVTDIAAAAGRAAGSFYTHFSDKEELLETLRAELGSVPAGDPAGTEPLREYVAACWKALRTHRPTAIALLQSAIAAAPASGRFREELTTWTAPLRRHLETRRDSPGDPELLAAAVGVLLAGLNHALPAGGEPEGVADVVSDLVLHGLAGPRDAPSEP